MEAGNAAQTPNEVGTLEHSLLVTAVVTAGVAGGAAWGASFGAAAAWLTGHNDVIKQVAEASAVAGAAWSIVKLAHRGVLARPLHYLTQRRYISEQTPS